jgi:hypothetical protein
MLALSFWEDCDMQTFLGPLLVTAILVGAFGTLYNSIRSRRTQGIAALIHRARMNIHMGVLFISIASLQLFLKGDSFLRLTLISLIFVLGALNLYYGIRNLTRFTKVLRDGENTQT